MGDSLAVFLYSLFYIHIFVMKDCPWSAINYIEQKIQIHDIFVSSLDVIENIWEFLLLNIFQVLLQHPVLAAIIWAPQIFWLSAKGGGCTRQKSEIDHTSHVRINLSFELIYPGFPGSNLNYCITDYKRQIIFWQIIDKRKLNLAKTLLRSIMSLAKIN